jgi:hypothetical protein
VLFLNLMFNTSEKTNIYLEGNYTAAKDDFNSFVLPEPEEAPGHWDGDFSKVNNYSDLEYNILSSTLGANWQFARRSSLYGTFTVMDFEDKKEYVYGDLSGTLYITTLGMRVGF